MGQNGQHIDGARVGAGLLPGGKAGQGVAAMAGVGENVSFRVPFGFLGRADHGFDFGKMIGPLSVGEKAEAGGGEAAARSPLEPFLAHALDGQFGEAAFHPAGQFDRFRSGNQLEAAGELHAAQNAQGVLVEGRAGVAQNAVAQIGRAAEKIQDLTRAGIVHDGVDGEVPAGGGLAERDGRIELNVKSLVAGSDLGIFAREGEIVGVAGGGGEFDHAKGTADQIGPAPAGKGGEELLVVQAEDFEVEVFLRWKAGQGIAHGAADQKGALQLWGLLENKLQFWRKEIHQTRPHDFFRVRAKTISDLSRR